MHWIFTHKPMYEFSRNRYGRLLQLLKVPFFAGPYSCLCNLYARIEVVSLIYTGYVTCAVNGPEVANFVLF